MTLHDLKTPLSGDKCLLCGGVPDVIGIFVPDDPGAFGGHKEKARIIRYCVCSTCRAMPGLQEKIEKVIKAEIFGAVVYYE